DFAGSDAATDVQAKQVLGAWDELKVTWKTQPKLGAAVSTAKLTGSIGYGQDGKWYEWDVTAIVQAWAAGQANCGIALDPAGDSGVDRDFVCKEYAQKAAYAPQLVVEYPGPDNQGKQ
ncbi:MAG TPA: DNRLRE domain-containing protein, partial [Candidatus Edwardsbacteria bacterium]|nr:DNRLRE domain-containing protein [Candidatus Edwardsbacteria bacterium]